MQCNFRVPWRVAVGSIAPANRAVIPLPSRASAPGTLGVPQAVACARTTPAKPMPADAQAHAGDAQA